MDGVERPGASFGRPVRASDSPARDGGYLVEPGCRVDRYGTAGSVDGSSG